MDLTTWKAGVEKDLDTGQSRDDVSNSALVLYFITRVREYMLSVKPQLVITIDDFNLVISNLKSSEELVWLYNLTFQDYFNFSFKGKNELARRVHFDYIGEHEDKLRAWKAMAYALMVFKEEQFDTEVVSMALENTFTIHRNDEYWEVAKRSILLLGNNGH